MTSGRYFDRATRTLSSCIVAITLLLATRFVVAQPQANRKGRATPAAVFKATIRPHWSADGQSFWYRNDLRGGLREYVAVDVAEGRRRPAFDHQRLAKAMRAAGMPDASADQLPIEKIELKSPEKTLLFRADGSDWQCHLETYELKKMTERTADPADGLQPLPPRNAPRASTRTGPETELTFVNKTKGEVEIFWRTTDGGRRSYGRLATGAKHVQHTFTGHVWEIVDAEGVVLAMFRADATPAQAEIAGKVGDYRRGRWGRRGRTPPRDASADGKWEAFTRDHNVYVRSNDSGDEIPLSHDGIDGDSYGLVQWAPDSKTLVAFRVQPGDSKEVHLIESSPRGGGRAKLRSRPYPLPGDKFASYELSLFDVAGKKQTKPSVDRIDFGRPRLRWDADGRRFTYAKTDRGHQRFRLIEVDSHTGEARDIIDEQTDTFIWTAHAESVGRMSPQWLSDTGEIIYASKRDGCRHLYLVDARSGEITQQITHGQYVVRSVDRIDEKQRQIWFRASGRNAEQDPYFVHFYRVNFDGSGLVALTEGNGNHSIQFSPDQKFLIDSYSRVDMAPVHELRRVSDGSLVCNLERADISELQESGWQPPEVFVAKGRDGQTDIWGIICRPHDWDPEKKYPIIEDIYAGPQSAYVPKSFSASRRYRSLTDLGFVVVKMDGMGTAHRSKAFHDVCWQNLKDAGFPDRILWIQAAAKKYPYMETTRVGIYGTSAGGQNAAGAVLFHPEFYKVAVASCGCHDNRMDKASWNEQWMGYPVGPHYAESSNIDNAHRLIGHLLLIVGELDTNVPPESTMRLVDALIKAGKDFDLVVIPGAGHGDGGSYGQRRLREFFVRHLIGGTAW